MVYDSKHKPVVELFGLREPPKTGRARLVHAAIELFYSHGFHAVGIDQVLAAAGVTKTTFDVLDVWFTAPDFRGCQFINAAAEFPNPHDPVQLRQRSA